MGTPNQNGDQTARFPGRPASDPPVHKQNRTEALTTTAIENEEEEEEEFGLGGHFHYSNTLHTGTHLFEFVLLHLKSTLYSLNSLKTNFLLNTCPRSTN